MAFAELSTDQMTQQLTEWKTRYSKLLATVPEWSRLTALEQQLALCIYAGDFGAAMYFSSNGERTDYRKETLRNYIIEASKHPGLVDLGDTLINKNVSIVVGHF